ncbi:MAG: Asp-tRNA(Asn)/Glu-tRNA(Gln) amidotransferase subunit GatB [Candidatus Komeilibacteria bacterium]
MEFDVIIGLETHIQLKTRSKLFCSCSNSSEDLNPNTAICPVCMGHPGVLPVLNKQALDWAILMSLGLNMEIAKETKFDRKNYFYPDLPKGYQISQFDKPVGEHGSIIINTDKGEKKIGITRLHLEEDAAKNLHFEDKTLVDYNRSSTPLVEIVSEPEMRTPAEAKAYMQEIRLIARYLGISDADMEKGNLRCDANISLRPVNEKKLSPKTEIKNINSFKNVEKALTYEVERQKQLWLSGEPPASEETRGWDADKGITYSQRSKEGSDDYRYFPEPDLPLFKISSGMIKQIEEDMVELPIQKRQRFAQEYGLAMKDIEVLIESKALANYFEKVVTELRSWLETEVEGDHDEVWEKNRKKVVKLANGWITTELFKLMKENKLKINDVKITPENMAEFITLIYLSKVNSSAAQIILKEMFDTGADPTHVMDDKDLGQMEAGEELDKIIDLIIESNPDQVAEFKAGKDPIIKYLIGLGMKATKGKGNPADLENIFREKLKD